MRHVLPILGLVLAAGCGSVVASENAAASVPASRSFPLFGFDRIALRGSDDVEVRVGPAESVSVTGPAALLDQLEVEVRDGELRLGRKRGRGPWREGTAQFTVTLPRLTAAAVAGSGDMRVDRAEARSFAASVAGSGNLSIAELAADALDLSVAGSGDLTVGGRTRALDVSIAGSGDVDATRLRAGRADVSVAGSGNVRAGVDSEAVVSILGSGDVDILGNATCRVSKMGSGQVRCGR